MQIFIGALLGALVQALGTIVGKILVSLGIGYAVYSGVDASITFARDYFITAMGGVGGNALAVAGTMKAGTCISILTSALTTRLTLNGLTSGTMKKFVIK